MNRPIARVAAAFAPIAVVCVLMGASAIGAGADGPDARTWSPKMAAVYLDGRAMGLLVRSGACGRQHARH